MIKTTTTTTNTFPLYPFFPINDDKDNDDDEYVSTLPFFEYNQYRARYCGHHSFLFRLRETQCANMVEVGKVDRSIFVLDYHKINDEADEHVPDIMYFLFWRQYYYVSNLL